MRIAIVGAGALGLYYGAMLQRGGNDVCFLLRSDYHAIRTYGLTVRSVDGDFRLDYVQCFRDPVEIGPVELVLVGLKCNANDRFEQLIRPLLGSDSMILTLQNGLGNEELLADLFGAERVLGGVAFLCSNRGEPGTVHHLGEGRILLGEYAGGSLRRAELLAELFQRSSVPCRAVADLRKVRWEKLVWNIPFNGLSALTLATVDQLLRQQACRQLILDIMAEVIAGANAQELSEPIQLHRAQEMVDVTHGLGAYRPSMLIDRELGRPLELSAIFSEPLRRASAAGVPMTRVAMLYALLDTAQTLWCVRP